MEKTRKVQNLVLGDWQHIEFQDLRKGDVFRLIEPDDEPVSDQRDILVFFSYKQSIH